MSLTPAAAIRELADDLRARVRQTAERQIIGIVGTPGAGKSTVARALADELGTDEMGAALCVVVPMDGFHLATSIIDGTPLQHRRGAIDTFDADGYLSLLRRLRARDEAVVYAPEYRRGLEEPIAASIAVPASVPIVLTEGNYLLAAADPWPQIARLCDEVCFVDTPSSVRLARLIARHVQFGMTQEQATAWANGPDATNARLIASTLSHADRFIPWS
ncbi:nucleoside/nucleotide kinase family protein [Cryobacterium sp. AP23]